MGKRQQSRGLALDLTPAQKQTVLQPLAYRLMEQERREILLTEAQTIIAAPLTLVSPQITGKEFLQMIENSSGLLIERENSVYSFAHQTFQEYLAAAHTKDQSLEKALVAQVNESWWHETIRLYAKQADATLVVAACLASERPSVPALTLAIECLEEAQRVDHTQRARDRGHNLESVRLNILAVAAFLTYLAQSQFSFSLLSRVKYILLFRGFLRPTIKSKELQVLAKSWLDAYVTLVILEERIQGNLLAFEGIRLVKERKKPSGS
ncbi:MAG: NACHT domain-containing NTPase [Candidatus Binatia bacterium]